MHLVKVYNRQIISHKQINFEDFDLLINSDLVLLDEEDYKKFGINFNQNVSGIKNLHSVKFIKNDIDMKKFSEARKTYKENLINYIKYSLNNDKLKVSHLKKACKKLISGRCMNEKEKKAIELIDVNYLPDGFFFPLNEM